MARQRAGHQRTSIGDYVHVDDALLHFYPYWQYYHSQPRLSWLRRVTQDWIVGQLTWDDRPNVESTDYMQFYTTQGQWSAADLTDFVQDVINLDQNNHGFMIHGNPSGQGNWKRIVSGNDTSSPDRRPHLVVKWHRPAATPASPTGGSPGGRSLAWNYDPGDAVFGTDQSHYWVQVATASTFGTGTIVRETSDGAGGKWAAGDDTSWTFPEAGTALTEGSTYYWRIKVRDGAGQSLWSAAASFVYLPDVRRGEEAFYTRVPFDLGGGWRLAVGVHNGELTLDRHLFEIPSFGPPQSLSLSYSSHNGASAYLGTGWSSNLTQRMTFAASAIYWQRADGGVVPFVQLGGTWTPPAGHFEQLSASGGEYILTLKDQSRLVFEGSGAGRLKRVENRFGHALTLSWNTGSATAIDASDPGRSTSIVIAGGLITSVTDSASRQWNFAYTSGQLTSTTDPEGAVTTLTYGSDGLTSISRQRSRVSGLPETITWSVDYTDGLVTGVRDPIDGSVPSTFAYSAGQTDVGLLQDYSPVVRNERSYTLDELGRVTETLDPEGYTTSYAFDADSNLVELVLPIDHSGTDQTISYNYDARGNVLTQTTQLTATESVVTAMSYNATNDLLTRSEADINSALKLVTRYTYDGAGHLTSVNVNCTSSGTSPPADASTCTGAGTQDSSTNLIMTFTYTANDQPATEADPRGIVTRHVYDSHGNEIETIANYESGQSATADRNVSTSFAYTAAGLVSSMTDPVANTTSYSYDDLGRQTVESLPGDASIPALTRTTVHDELGNVLTETEAWTGVSRTTSHVYDKANRETSVTDPAGVETETAYDAAGNSVSTTAGGVTTKRDFDGLGRATAEGSPGAQTAFDYDGQGRQIGSVDPEDVETTFVHDRAGRLLSEKVAAADGDLVSSYAYDALGRETASTTADGVTTTTEYDRAGRRFEVNVAGALSIQAYDRAGNETSTTAPDGTVTTTQYDALSRPTVVVANNVANPADATEDVTTTSWYDGAGRTVAFTDGGGISSRSIYNVRGLVKESISNCTDSGTTPTSNPPGCTGGGTHDATTNVVTTSEYDGSGSLTVAVVAVGTGAQATIRYAYDAAGRRQAQLDPRDTVTRTVYDAEGRVISTIANCTDDTSSPAPPSGAGWWNCEGSTLEDGTWNVTTSRTYNTRGNVAAETAPNGRRTEYVYDDADRLIERIDNAVSGTPAADENLSTYFAYDDAGRQSAVRAPTADRNAFSVTRYLYDENGHVIKDIRNCVDSNAWALCEGSGTTDADTNLVTLYGYNERGNRVSVTAADPSATTGTSVATATTRYAYDVENRLCGVLENATVVHASPDACVSPGSSTATANVWTAYTYDGLGNLATMTDGEGHITTYGYDGAGRMVTITDGLGNTTTYGYDDLGRRTTQSERGTGSQPTLVSWAYDAGGRMVSRTTDAGTTSYGYDENGNRESADGPGGKITAIYDRLNRPLTVTVDGDPGAATSYTYSLHSASWSDPSGTYSATLDAFERQVSLSDPLHGSSAFGWTYRADGRPATTSAPNGNTTTFSYDDTGALEAKETANSSATPAAYGWTRNRAGQILSEDSAIDGDPTNGTTAYAYDPLGRLTSFQRASSSTAYSWQGVPNRSSIQVDSDPAVAFEFDAANRETTSSTGNIDYDVEGRLTARPGQTLEWNQLGQLTSVIDPASETAIASYTYDGLDRLLTVTHGSDVIRFRYVGLTTQVAQVVEVDGQSETVLYSVANDWSGRRLFEWAGSSATFYGTNGHHDVTWTADGSGDVSATLRYDPWGNPSASTGSSLPAFRFQGSWFDPSVELSWVITRWYAPSLGRFTSEDSLLGRPADPGSRHLYAYGAGEPLGRWDPDGAFWYRWQAGDDLWRVASKYYGHGWRLSDIIAGNPGPPWTSVSLRNTPRPGNCIWIPYVSRLHQCNLDRAARDSTGTGDALYGPHDRIVRFIYDEMKANSRDGAGGVGLYPTCASLLHLLFGCPHAHQQHMVLKTFGRLVEPGGAWDHKPKLQDMFRLPRNKAFYTAFRYDPVPDALRHDVWSNIHYGYVGMAHRIPQTILEAGQFIAGDNLFDKSDSFSVDLGFRLWKRYGHNLTKSQFEHAVRAALPAYRRIADGDPRPVVLNRLVRLGHR